MASFAVRKSSLVSDLLLIEIIIDANDLSLEAYELLKNIQEYQETQVGISVKHCNSDIERVRNVLQSVCDAQDDASSD